jgi:hypothetical protein
MKHDIECDNFPIVLDLDSRQNLPPALLGGMLKFSEYPLLLPA